MFRRKDKLTKRTEYHHRVVRQLEHRERLRDEKSWQMADILRDDLVDQGWEIEDYPSDVVIGYGSYSKWHGSYLQEDVYTARTHAQRRRKLVKEFE